MARQRRKGPQQTAVVDGFTTIQIAKRAVDKQKPDPSSKAPSTAEPFRKPPETAASTADGRKTRIDHTAQPSRHEVVCFECGYEFFLTGQLSNVYCPKCRTILEARDLTITGEWTGEMKTVGSVRVEPGAVVRGGRIVAGNLVLAGRIDGGRAEITGELEIRGQGGFVPGTVDLTDLAIGADSDVEFAGEFEARNISIAGRLKAKLKAGGLIEVKAGGLFRGSAHSARFAMEDGGGIDATLNITGSAARAGGGNGGQ